jgi:hypothetical protein
MKAQTDTTESIGRFLLGFADLFELLRVADPLEALIPKLREIGRDLIARNKINNRKQPKVRP